MSELYQHKHFNILQVTFWDTKETIEKNYTSILKILKENNIKPQKERKDYGITVELLEKSYKILTDPNEREHYLSFLKYYYFLAEPISLQQLKNNYNNKIFPFYLFSIKIKERAQICDLTIDFINKKLTIEYKNKLHQLIPFYLLLYCFHLHRKHQFQLSMFLLVHAQIQYHLL